MKVSASALQSVLTISIIIVLVVSLLLVLSMRMSASFLMSQRFDTLHRNAASGMNLLLSGGEVDLDENSNLDLFGSSSDSVCLKKVPWGIYEVYTAFAFANGDTIKREGLVGNLLLDEEKQALRLADKHRPLSVSGETRIIGNVLIPEAGIRKAYIEGKAYTGDKTVYGSVAFSEPYLPALNEVILEGVRSLLYPARTDSTDNYESFGVDSMNNGFNKPVQYLFSKDSLRLENIFIKGNVIVLCNSAVEIDSSAKLEDIQIYAPSVTIKEGFKGSVQVFSRDSIRVQKNVALEYPSVLGLVATSKSVHHYDDNPRISISEHSRLDGIVFSSTDDEDNALPIIQIDKGATVHGQVFASGMLQLQGEVLGSTLTRGFILKTPSTLYENFVLDGVMDFNRLSEYYLGSRLLNKNKVSGILKWL